MPKKQVLRIRNGGRWTEAEFRSFIKSALRSASMRWRPISECLKKARVGRGLYKCAICGKEVPASLPPEEGKKRRIKNIVVDHIHPVIDPNVGFVSWDRVIERMFVEEEALQAVCRSCHLKKSKEESDERVAARLEKKDKNNKEEREIGIERRNQNI